jgi:NADH-quinone oxidoreductase subunit L
MAQFLNVFILIPLVGFIISLLISGKKETLLSWSAFVSVGAHLITAGVFIVLWLMGEHTTLNIKDIVLYEHTGYEFFIDFSFDKITAVYLFVGSFLTFLVTIYSRYYMHREVGYKRFFNTILFFFLGYNVVIFSGNLETMFIGWEMLGI